MVFAALLITPGVWSALTNLNASSNQSLPGAYSGQSLNRDGLRGVQVNQPLLDFLQQNTQGMTYLMAVPSAMQGADYILVTGRPVLYMGGFMGRDPVVTSEDLQRLVDRGELRYIYWDARGGSRGPAGGGDQSSISTWVQSACTLVQGFNTNTQNAGAPDGTATPGEAFMGRGDMEVSLYDCG